jgi:hypothetical protein
LAKIIGQNHQVLGVNAAIASLHRIHPALADPATLTPSCGRKPHSPWKTLISQSNPPKLAISVGVEILSLIVQS